MMDRSTLPIPHVGDYLSADQMATVFDFVKNPPWANGGNYGGFSDPYGSAFFQTKNHRPSVRVIADENYPRNSALILGGDPNAGHVYPVDDGSYPEWMVLRANSAHTGGKGTSVLHRCFVTNEAGDLYSNQCGWGTIIGNDPIPVLADPYWPPVPFHPCGPEHGKTTVSGRSAGLMAVSNVNDNGLVWVKAHTPRFFYAVSTSQLDEAGNSSTDPSSCTVDVLFPKHPLASASWPDELEVSQDPAFLGLEVYNHDTTLEVPSGTFGHIVFEWGRWHFVWTAC